MPSTQRSREGTLNLMAQYGGWSWPNPWWPQADNRSEDCAACVSWALFGLSGGGGPYFTLVSQIQNHFAAQNRREWGNAHIQRGDVLAFSWTKDRDSFDHTEIALGPVSGNGLITSRGTNSNPGDDLRDRTRSASFVVSYSHPDYSGSGVSPAALQEDDMKLTAIRNFDGSIGLVDSAGLLTTLKTVDEWQSYLRLGIVEGGNFIQQNDGTVWNALSKVTARTIAQHSGLSPVDLATTVAPFLVQPIADALSAGGVVATDAQLLDATNTALRNVLAPPIDPTQDVRNMPVAPPPEPLQE